MTLIVAHKHMKLPKSIALTCCAILALSGNGLSAKAAETRSGNMRRTFADWCRQKADLSPEAKHTVEVLLQKLRLLSAMRLIRNFRVSRNSTSTTIKSATSNR
jgi:hypothetical protein